jgi:hypothetical protein
MVMGRQEWLLGVWTRLWWVSSLASRFMQQLVSLGLMKAAPFTAVGCSHCTPLSFTARLGQHSLLVALSDLAPFACKMMWPCFRWPLQQCLTLLVSVLTHLRVQTRLCRQGGEPGGLRCSHQLWSDLHRHSRGASGHLSQKGCKPGLSPIAEACGQLDPHATGAAL